MSESRLSNLRKKLAPELKSVAVVTTFFLIWLGSLMCLKTLILKEYQIQFSQFSLAVVGALVLAKVVLILEHVPLGSWLERQPAWVDLFVRAGLYTLGAFVALLLEKAFEARHEYGGFSSALTNIFDHRDMPHVWANTICIAGALVTYNFLTLLSNQLGPAGLRKILLSPPIPSHPHRHSNQP